MESLAQSDEPIVGVYEVIHEYEPDLDDPIHIAEEEQFKDVTAAMLEHSDGEPLLIANEKFSLRRKRCNMKRLAIEATSLDSKRTRRMREDGSVMQSDGDCVRCVKMTNLVKSGELCNVFRGWIWLKKKGGSGGFCVH